MWWKHLKCCHPVLAKCNVDMSSGISVSNVGHPEVFCQTCRPVSLQSLRGAAIKQMIAGEENGCSRWMNVYAGLLCSLWLMDVVWACCSMWRGAGSKAVWECVDICQNRDVFMMNCQCCSYMTAWSAFYARWWQATYDCIFKTWPRCMWPPKRWLQPTNGIPMDLSAGKTSSVRKWTNTIVLPATFTQCDVCKLCGIYGQLRRW